MSRPATTPVLSVAALRRLAAALATSTAPDAAWLRAGIERYLAEAPEGVSLETCLGLTAAGRRSWWCEEQLARRNAALRAAGDEFLPDLGVTARAEELARALRGYRMPRDDSETARRAASKRPAIRRRIIGLAGADQAPLCDRHIRRILLNEPPGLGHELPEEMSRRACDADSHEPENR